MRTNMAIKTMRKRIWARNIVRALIALLIAGCSQPVLAQQLRARTFTSPGQACQALYESVKDKNEQALQDILGAGPELTASGEADIDKLERERFVQKYQEMHRLVREPDGSAVLHIGAENWPFPVPLVETGGKWHFDSEAGAQEILARKIGENETTAIEVCQAFIKATQQNAQAEPGDPVQQFARTIVDTGAANPVSGPFNGYYFRVVAGKPTGVALVAYPAEYRKTGVMTFIVTGGVHVYEKDLGPKTAVLAQKIKGKPHGKWNTVLESPAHATGEGPLSYLR